MIQLTDADLDAAQNGQPVRLTDPAREGEFVLLSAESFRLLRSELNAQPKSPDAGDARAGRYLAPEFSRQLLDHCQRAVRSAVQFGSRQQIASTTLLEARPMPAHT